MLVKLRKEEMLGELGETNQLLGVPVKREISTCGRT